jgi:hypothetical protein
MTGLACGRSMQGIEAGAAAGLFPFHPPDYHVGVLYFRQARSVK